MASSRTPLPIPDATTPAETLRQGDIRYIPAPPASVLNPPSTTGMPFWSINPYVGCAFGCAYCYARYAHRWVAARAREGRRLPVVEGTDGDEADDLPDWLAFERRIFVKARAAEALRRDLQRASGAGGLGRGGSIAIGTATDPYQPAERHFGITRSLLEVLAEVPGVRVGLITKSALVTRDVDVLARLAARGPLTVQVSLITLDRELARRVEPRAPTPEARLRTVRRLAEAGLDVGVNVMPVLPGLTDRPDALRALVEAVASHGATHLNACALRLRATSRRRFLPWLDAEFPALRAAYSAGYGGGFQVSEGYRDGLRRFMRRACARAGLRYGAEAGEAEAREAPAARREAAVDGGDAQLGLWAG